MKMKESTLVSIKAACLPVGAFAIFAGAILGVMGLTALAIVETAGGVFLLLAIPIDDWLERREHAKERAA